MPNFKRNNILAEAHGGAIGGNYVGKATMQKILRTAMWWPKLHKHSKAYCRACDACQRMGRPSRRDELPLIPQVSLQPFEKWAIDFVGMIQPRSKKIGARTKVSPEEIWGDVGTKFPHPEISVMSFYDLDLPSHRSLSAYGLQ